MGAAIKEKILHSFKAEIKADTNTNNMSISGYASVFNVIDSYGDAIKPGAFAKTIMENMSRVKMLYQHSLMMPIGKITSLSEDSKGLYFSSVLSNTTMGRDCYQLAKDGILDEVSIGFNSIKDEYINNIRVISEVKLWEISLVTFAANEYAKITDVKKHPDFIDLLNKNLELEREFVKIKDVISALTASKPQRKALANDKPHEIGNNPDENLLNQLLQVMKTK
jgi:uncharacterized protein